MSDPDDLIKKADALLGRYGPPSTAGADADIPVLTEVVERPGVPPERPQGAALSESQIEALISRVRDDVATSLEARIQERLAGHLEAALATLAERMRSEIEPLVRATVEEALSRLDAELRTSGARRMR